MKSLQTAIDQALKQRGYRFWVSCLVLLFGLPLLLYYGYCWGLWGRHSLLLQYLFQCNCPAASQEARYPRSVDVIVSACRYGSSILSPSGHFLAVHEKESANTPPYILDLQTGEKISVPLPEKGGIYFLTDNWLYISVSYDEKYVLDRTTGSKYPVRRYLSVYPGTFVGGYADLNLLAETLQQAKYVFFIRDDSTVVALDPDFPISVEKSFLTGWLDLPAEYSMQVEQFLKEYNVTYQVIQKSYPEEVISPDRRFVARPDGIYLLGTGQRIIEGPAASRFYRAYSRKYFFARGWTYDGRAVIYSKFLDPCLIETTFFIFDDPYCFIEVPQPLLKLKVPEEYLLPKQTP